MEEIIKQTTAGDIPYAVKFSQRARRMRISVGCDCAVTVVLPRGFSSDAADSFVQAKLNWIKRSLQYFRSHKNISRLKFGRREYLRYKAGALTLARGRVAYWNQYYKFDFNRVTIKNSKTRWGSCSRRGNLNFNYKIVYLPERLLNYLIVHELCHLKEFNHSRKFWELVEKSVPNHKILRKELRSFCHV